MKDKAFKQLVKLKMEELGIVWTAYAYLQDGSLPKIKRIEEEVTEETKIL